MSGGGGGGMVVGKGAVAWWDCYTTQSAGTLPQVIFDVNSISSQPISVPWV